MCTAAMDEAEDLGLSVLDVFDMRAAGGERIREALAKAGAQGGKVSPLKSWRIETMAKKQNLPQEVRDYMAELGKRGGKANKGRADRAEICRKAAQARWAKVRAKKETAEGKTGAK